MKGKCAVDEADEKRLEYFMSVQQYPHLLVHFVKKFSLSDDVLSAILAEELQKLEEKSTKGNAAFQQ